MVKQTKSCISTIGGEFFDLKRPSVNEYNIEEMAHSLSRINRYTGHIVPENYTVAEHCYHVSHAVPEQHALAGLLHDASEAFVGDVSSPLKKLLGRVYTDLEDAIQEEIAKRFGIEYPFHEEIHLADKRLYWAERREIAPSIKDTLWHQDLRASRKVTPVGWRPNKAKRKFLERFKELTQDARADQTVCQRA